MAGTKVFKPEYTHSVRRVSVCTAKHCLNWILEASKSNKHSVTSFNLVLKLYVLCGGSPKNHAALVRLQQSLNAEGHIVELKRLSDRHWACRQQALKKSEMIMMLLDEICERDSPDLALVDAKMDKSAINFAFIRCMDITTQPCLCSCIKLSAKRKSGPLNMLQTN